MSLWAYESRILILISVILGVSSEYVVPGVEFMPLDPQGLKVSIPDAPDIKLFWFYGKVNGLINSKNAVTINKNTTSSKIGRWIIEDSTVRLKVNDIINYWVFVQFENVGYRKDRLEYVVQRLVPPTTSWPQLPEIGEIPDIDARHGKPEVCNPSITRMDNDKMACAGQVIFQDNFEFLDKTKWIVEKRLPDQSQDNPFVSYQPLSVKVTQDQLMISPQLQQSVLGFQQDIMAGSLDLNRGCTTKTRTYCEMKAEGANIIPPVVSGRISSRESFSFKYGKVEIRAKLPQGDWLYPEIYLVPTNYEYGDNGYESGIMRIAFARGNLYIEDNLGNKVLSGGVLLDTLSACRTLGTDFNPSTSSSTPWGDNFHVYELLWDEYQLIFSVDGEKFGTVTPQEENGFKMYHRECNDKSQSNSLWEGMAPFDKEFHVVIGVGVAGISDFPDDIAGKPWKNQGSKAKSTFYRALGQWNSTWIGKQHLLVDYIKITAF